MSVVDAIARELDGMPGDLGTSGLAATALALAEQLDDRETVCPECGEVVRARNAPTALAMCARELRETMNKLRELAPAREESDWLDELKADWGADRESAPAPLLRS